MRERVTLPSLLQPTFYQLYRELIESAKTAAESPLQTCLEGGGHHRESATVSLSVSDKFDNVSFKVVIKVADHGHYELKIFCGDFGGRPVFRFESRGNGHMNPEDGQGLPARHIKNPHFHEFRADSVEWAFRPPQLEDPTIEEAILKSYADGLQLFCEIARITDSLGQPVQVNVMNPLLPLTFTPDPLNGVMFT